MKLVKSLFVGTGSVVLAVLLLTLLAPKAMHAVVATLVQVANTSSTPVPVSSINDQGRVPYQAQAVNLSCLSGNFCTYTFVTVPANHRLVIQQVSVYTGDNAASPSARVSLGEFNFAQIPMVGTYSTTPVLGYFDGGSVPTASILLTSSGVMNGFGSVNLSGYMVDCSVASCSAIITQ